MASSKKRKKGIGELFDVKAGSSSDEFDSDVFLREKTVEEKETEEIRIAREEAYRRVERRKQTAGLDLEEMEKRYEEESLSEASLDEEAVEQSSVLAGDTGMWSVKCLFGCEKQILDELWKRNRPEDEILSVVYRDKIKGVLYFESYREDKVREVIRRTEGLFSSKVSAMSADDRKAVLDTEEAEQIEVGSWIRMKSGKYSGDVGKVVGTKLEEGIVSVQLMPRFWLAGEKEASNERPPKRLFDSSEVILKEGKNSVSYSSKGEFWIYKKEQYNRDGYVEKDVSINSVLEDFPSEAEMNVFKGERRVESKEEAFKEGDCVIITKGEFVGVVGSVVSVNQQEAIVQPSTDDIFSRCTVPVVFLERNFDIGDLVDVSAGKYSGKAGSVVAKEKGGYTVLIEKDKKAIVLQSSDLRPLGLKKQKEITIEPASGFKKSWNKKAAKEREIGKSVRVLSGSYKGYVGIIRSISDGLVSVELHTNALVVDVKKEHVLLEEKKEEKKGVHGKTPMWNGAQGKTPMWSGMEGKTPMWGGLNQE